MEEKNTDTKTKVPAEFKSIIDAIEKMSISELNDLVKVFEEKFNVSAASIAQQGGGGDGAQDNEPSVVTVELQAAGDQKIAVIKAIKEILGIGLKEAKDLVDAAPSVIKKDVEKKEADEMVAKIKEAGGTVALK